MIDTYLKSKNKAALEELHGFVTNMIDPALGQVGTPECTTDDGVLPAQPAKGDPEYWYTCVRAPFSIPPYGDIESCTVDEGSTVCGVWS